jgi:GTP-binding protein HflX
VVDGRGLGRLLWVGDLEQSGRLLERLPGSSRRQGSALRLLTAHRPSPSPPPRVAPLLCLASNVQSQINSRL